MEIEKVIDALKTLKQCCIESEKCRNCQLRGERVTNECGLHNAILGCKPCDWKLDQRTWTDSVIFK